MPRRGENIFKRKDGRWEARYIHHYENGKAKYRYIYGKTYAEVKMKQAAELTRMSIEKEPILKPNATVEEIAGEWLRDVKISVKESSYTRYHRIVNKYIVPKLGGRQIVRVDSLVLNRFSEELLLQGGIRSKALSPKTVADILCVVKAIYRFGRQNGYSCPNLEGVRYPQRTGKQIKILSQDCRNTLEKLLINSEDTTSLGILFSLFTGIRIGELCGLRWDDIDLVDSTVRICRTVERLADLDPQTETKTKLVISEPKTENSVRTIPIPTFLKNHLVKYKKADNTYLISGSSVIIEPHCFYMRYKKFLRRNSIDDHTFHALRHTFATRCVELGFDIKSLSEILGHANVTTTMMFYVHPSMEQKRNQMELLLPTYC